jgi:hypothetical protein
VGRCEYCIGCCEVDEQGYKIKMEAEDVIQAVDDWAHNRDKRPLATILQECRDKA